ncbi:MAG: prepilin-type N-terminal cleavage/methylation domain-containing protein [Verrucomicrobiota bacterium]
MTPPPTLRHPGFSLIELLVVMGVIGLLFALVIPAIGTFGSAGTFTSAASVLSETMEEARAYAVSKRTYVYVGIGEFNASAPADTWNTGNGRIALFAAASQDGSRIVHASDFATKAQPISRLVRLQNVHLALITGTGGGLQRPSDGSVQTLGSSSGTANMSFPLSGTPRCSFNQCLEFSPQGMVRFFGSANLPGFIEIGMAPTKGDVVIATQNVAVIQLSGLTGRSTLYRP